MDDEDDEKTLRELLKNTNSYTRIERRNFQRNGCNVVEGCLPLLSHCCRDLLHSSAQAESRVGRLGIEEQAEANVTGHRVLMLYLFFLWLGSPVKSVHGQSLFKKIITATAFL